MKKLFISLLSLVLVSGVSFALSENGTALLSPEFKTMNFQATMDNGAVALSWDSFQLPEGHTFGYWKVLRSSTSENPIFADGNENVIFQSSDISLTKFKHMSPWVGNNWYRVCAVTKASDGYHRICSSEVKKIVISVPTYTGATGGVIYPPVQPNYTWLSPEFKAMDLEAELENSSVYLSWDAFQLPEGQKFAYWKVMRSQTSDNPIYVDGKGDYIMSSSTLNFTQFKDPSPRPGNNWYRVCIITKGNDGIHRYCSSEVKKVVVPYSVYTGSTGNSIYPPQPNYTWLAPEFKNMNFQANLENKIVYMSWNPFQLPSGQTFLYWKIMRSLVNENPIYVDGKGDYITHSSDINLTTFKDTSPKPGTNWYRICAVTKGSDGIHRYCSNEVKKVIINSSTVRNPENTGSGSVIGATLTNEQKTMLDTLATDFLKKLDEKYPNDTLKRNMVLSNIITQLKKLADKQPSLRPLISYLVSKLQPTTSTDPMDQLRNILKLD